MSDSLQNKTVSIVMPFYNEYSILRDSLDAVLSFFNNHRNEYGFEIILIDDSREGQSVESVIGNRYAQEPLKVLDNISNKGKGFSVKRGVQAARGRYILVIDADLQISIGELEPFLKDIDAGSDIVIASRLLPGARLTGKQSLLRHILRNMLRIIVRVLLRLHLTDSQCGFKVFEGEKARHIFKKQTIAGFAYDIEILMIAEKEKLKIKERPVEWTSSDTSTVNILLDGIRMVKDLINIKLKYCGTTGGSSLH